LQDSFATIIPLLLNVCIFLGLNTVVSAATAGTYTVPSGFMALLSDPLNALVSVPGIFILCTLASLLWCFGIHGVMVILPIVMPLAIQASTANAAAHAAGKPLVVYPILLMGGLSMVGGSGNTLPLALLGLRSKSKQISAVARISAIPGWFNINEPLTFGLPIMYNPILCIPYVLNVPVVILLTYLGYKTGFIIPSWITITAMLPMGFSGYLSTLNWRNALWDYLMIIPTTLIYYPFFKIYEKQLIAKEAEVEKLEAEATQD
ncbi:PTS transporter subunit EIIC, partial [Streptococcus hyointestinalis]|uniref:PTS transporter subunit EIIC n=1 Tax=Streptococcus hyointestinalis TaxID=1337 RepID=UPI003CFD9CA7